MKALKIIVGILIALIAIAVLVVALALTPAIQTWAVRKAVANEPGMKLDVSHLAVGLSSADLQHVHFVKDGLVVTAARVTARYSAWDFISHHKINVDDLTVDDLVVDARHGSTASPSSETTAPPQPQSAVATQENRPAAQPATSQPSRGFNGVLSQIKLPYDVRIARFSVPGKALLPDDQTATFELHGSNIGTDQNGTIDWKADLTNSAPNAPFQVVHTSGSATVHLTAERRIDLLAVNGVASVEGPKLPSDQVKLEAKAEQPAAGGNEGYNATVSLVHNAATEPLLTIAAQYNASARQIAGAWNISVRTEQLAALLSGLGLPDIAAEGSGKFTANPDANAVTANGELRSDISRLEKISPDLGPIGTLHVQTRFDGGMKENITQLQQFTLDATAANGRRLAEISTLQPVAYSLADKRISFANGQSDLAHISIESLPLAWAQPFVKQVTIDSGELSMVLAVAAAADGSHVRVTSVQPLTVRNLTARQGDQKLADRLNLSVKPQADYSPDHLRAELNDLTVSSPTGDTVNGRFTADVTHLSKTPNVAFTTDTQAKFVALLKPYLKADTGPLLLSTKSAGTAVGNTLHFESSATKITRPNGELIAAIDLEQPLTLNTQTNTVTASKPDAEALRVALGQVPLAWAQGYVANAQFDGQVTGGAVGITVRTMSDLTANAVQPITVRGASVTMNNQPMLQNVDLTADFTATKHGDDIAYNVRKVEVKQGATSLLNLVVAGEAKMTAKPALSAKGTLAADLGALMQQPAVAGKAGLERGNLDANFDAKITDTIQADATITARNLVAKENNQPLGDAELKVTAAVQPDGSSDVKVPFTLTNGSRKSDLLIDGKLARAANSVTFNGRITSNLLVVDDLKPLAGLAPSSTPAEGTTTTRPVVPAVSPTGAPPPSPSTSSAPQAGGTVATAPTTAPGTRDAAPFWNGFGGNVTLDLKQIDYGKDYQITAVQGSAAITPAQLAVPALQGNFNNNPFKVTATIAFDAQQPQPYTLAATATVTNFDVGAFLKAANPSQPPQLETNVTVDAKVNGTGGTLGDLAQHAYGTFDLNGSKGVLRALGQKSGTAVNLGSTLLGVLGAAQGSDTATALSELTRKLAELPFDKFDMHVERGADLNLKVGRIEFLSADTRVLGSGGIKNEPGVPIQNQPMQFTLQLSGKEGMAFLLNRLHALSGKQDDQGYYTMNRTFTLGGTPSNPDSSDLWKFLAQVGTQMAVPGILKMFGK